MSVCAQCERGNHGAACIRWRECDCDGALCGTPRPLDMRPRSMAGAPDPNHPESEENDPGRYGY